MQPLSLMLDEQSVREFAGFVDAFVSHEHNEHAAHRQRVLLDGAPLPSTLFEHSMLTPMPHTRRDSVDRPALDVWGKVFLEALDVSSISLRATLKRAPGGSQGLSLNPFYALFNLLTTALISIDDAPIRLHPLRRAAVFMSPEPEP